MCDEMLYEFAGSNDKLNYLLCQITFLGKKMCYNVY